MGTKGTKIEIERSSNEQFFFRFVAANGEKVLNGEMYTTKGGCEHGVSVVMALVLSDDPVPVIDITAGEKSTEAPRYEIAYDKNTQFILRLIASNGEPVAHGESYTSRQNCKKCIDLLPDIARGANIIDLTLQK